jgi:TPR repeat protein
MTHLYKNAILTTVMCLIILILSACATTKNKVTDPFHLAQGKRDMETGYYKRAMQQLLGPACDGNAQAQYAVGYMYYYGYGVAQDTEVGYFWIKRSANQGNRAAIEALRLMEHQNKKFNPKDRYR